MDSMRYQMWKIACCGIGSATLLSNAVIYVCRLRDTSIARGYIKIIGTCIWLNFFWACKKMLPGSKHTVQ
eukprot:11248656-Prorocentrum_lima.AAC.1